MYIQYLRSTKNFGWQNNWPVLTCCGLLCFKQFIKCTATSTPLFKTKLPSHTVDCKKSSNLLYALKNRHDMWRTGKLWSLQNVTKFFRFSRSFLEGGGGQLGLIMIIISLRFSRKNDSKWWSFFAKKGSDHRDNRYFAKNKKLAIIAIIVKRLSL